MTDPLTGLRAPAAAGSTPQPENTAYRLQEDPSQRLGSFSSPTSDLGLRCPHCLNLRGATPLHKPDCPLAYRNCPGCIDPFGAEHVAFCRLSAALDAARNRKEEDAQSAGPGNLYGGALSDATGFVGGTGIDVPGVGHQLPGGAVLRGRDGGRGEVPQPLRDLVDGVELRSRQCTQCGGLRDDNGICMGGRMGSGGSGRCADPTYDKREEQKAQRDALLAQLLFASKDLAEGALGTLRPRGKMCVYYCCECRGFAVTAGAMIEHMPTCRAGRVLGILDELAKLGGAL
jgi:hypothetical protein